MKVKHYFDKFLCGDRCMNLIDYVVDQTSKYIEQMPKKDRKKYGQFFTSKETAVFMASLFDVPTNVNNITVLDPGAGSGLLSVALIERLQDVPNIESVDITCYETDSNVLPLLRANLDWVRDNASICVTFRIIFKNYILSQEDEYNALYDDCNLRKYDMVIGNPPYMKFSKEAPEVKAMKDVCYGAPNIYFLFAAMSLFNLKKDGVLVYIIPRSWTSGAYFKRFRQKFLTDGALEHVHLFVSRDKVFEKESVLQETIIIKVKKTERKPRRVTVTTTNSNHDFSEITTFTAPYSTIVSGDEMYVYLVTNQYETKVLDRLTRLKNSLPDIGLRMKTGLTVDFRNWDVLRSEETEGAVPLFYAQHIRHGEVVFPIGKEHEYIKTEQQGLLQPNENYLFVKRFTSKEESRRLQCGVYLSKMFSKYKSISTQNKINFISGTKKLSECVVYGLYVLFNSTVYDNYYRILNGSTQVNSTEINSMPVPSMKVIEEMGKLLMASKDMSVEMCDDILGRYV